MSEPMKTKHESQHQKVENRLIYRVNLASQRTDQTNFVVKEGW